MSEELRQLLEAYLLKSGSAFRLEDFLFDKQLGIEAPEEKEILREEIRDRSL